jgi:methylisocitrate lyase
MWAVEDGLRTIRDEGTQAAVVDRMQTRAELYDLIGYEQYTVFDADVFNFEL